MYYRVLLIGLGKIAQERPSQEEGEGGQRDRRVEFWYQIQWKIKSEKWNREQEAASICWQCMFAPIAWSLDNAYFRRILQEKDALNAGTWIEQGLKWVVSCWAELPIWQRVEGVLSGQILQKAARENARVAKQNYTHWSVQCFFGTKLWYIFKVLTSWDWSRWAFLGKGVERFFQFYHLKRVKCTNCEICMQVKRS